MIQQPFWYESAAASLATKVYSLRIEDILMQEALDDKQYRIFVCGMYSGGEPSYIEIQCMGRKERTVYAASRQIDDAQAARAVCGTCHHAEAIELLARLYSEKLSEQGFQRVDEFTHLPSLHERSA